MKNKIINAAICDAREVTEESLAGFESITINAAALITAERSKEVLNKYPVTMNVASVIELPEGQNITVRSVNGMGEIGPDSDGTGTFLLVNGKLTVANDSLEAVKSYYKIIVNGKALMPESYREQARNVTVNGKTVYYPDGATILKADTKVDDLYISRATNTFYYCPGNIFFLDTDIDVSKLIEKGLRFSASRIIVAKNLLNKIAPQFSEASKVVCVPDGTCLIEDDLDLKAKTIRRFGTKLFVSGDVSIEDQEALASLEYLYVDGTVSIRMDLEEAFESVESVYDELRTIDPDQGYLSDHPLVKIGATALKKYPHGVKVEDCAKVTLSEELTADEIMEKLHISDCAMVLCTKEQEEAVHFIAEDVAIIKVSDRNSEDEGDGVIGGIMSALGKLKDTQVVNAVEYRL